MLSFTWPALGDSEPPFAPWLNYPFRDSVRKRSHFCFAKNERVRSICTNYTKNSTHVVDAVFLYGPPWGIRTLDHRNRNPVLYPVELRADVLLVYHIFFRL